MKIKIDENLPRSLAEALHALGHDAHSVYDEQLQGQSDTTVWQAVVKEERFLITQDVEFGNLQKYPLGSHFGILLLRLHSPDRERVKQLILHVFQNEPVERWRGGLVIVSEHKLRVLLPEGSV